jgi:hypothetical protein
MSSCDAGIVVSLNNAFLGHSTENNVASKLQNCHASVVLSRSQAIPLLEIAKFYLVESIRE